MPAGGSAVLCRKPVATCLQWCLLLGHDVSSISGSKPVLGKAVELLSGTWTTGSKPCLQGLRGWSMGSLLWVLSPKQHGTVILPGQTLLFAHEPCPRPFPILPVLLHSKMWSLPSHRETLSHSPAAHSSPNRYLLCQLPLLTTSKGPTEVSSFAAASCLSSHLLFAARGTRWMSAETQTLLKSLGLAVQSELWVSTFLWWLDHG